MTQAAFSFNWGAVTIDELGLSILDADEPRWVSTTPLQAQVQDQEGNCRWLYGRYDQVSSDSTGALAKGTLPLADGVDIVVVDRWEKRQDQLHFCRTATVIGSLPGHAFLTAFELTSAQRTTIADYEPFVPAMMYGDNSFLPPYAIGSSHYLESGTQDVMIREDRMPAPLIALRAQQGSSIALIHCDPRGTTTLADVSEQPGDTVADQAFDFGSLGFRQDDGHVRTGIWFPGTEGSVTYGKRGTERSRPGTWCRRYHPVASGITQSYQLAIALRRTDDFGSLVRWSWRKAFSLLSPQVAPQDMDAVESSIISHLSDQIRTTPKGAIGINFKVQSRTQEVPLADFGLGFCTRNENVAYHLLRIGHRDGNQHYLDQARRILDFWTSNTGPGFTFVNYHVDKEEFGGPEWRESFGSVERLGPQPPEGEAVSLREQVEGHQGCLWSWQLEKERGISHPEWLDWCVGFADWLLSQRLPSGGFPRWWLLDGSVYDPSDKSSYNAIAFLCELADITGRQDYLEAAIRTAENAWSDHQSRGIFVGGTIDNPNVIDKEAASVAMEGFLALHKATGEQRWLDAAQLAADVAETWIYIWDIPMPIDEDLSDLEWKQGATTVGLQVITTGGSGSDQYLSWNVDEYAQLYDLTGDEHYLDVAKILLHNTKVMLAIPGRLHGLPGPGWQQEHWFMVANRGWGWPGNWLAWVTASHLTGMSKLQLRNLQLWDQIR